MSEAIKVAESLLLSPSELLGDLNAERNEMDKIYNQLIANNHPLRSWYYAHFHQSHTEFIDNISY